TGGAVEAEREPAARPGRLVVRVVRTDPQTVDVGPHAVPAYLDPQAAAEAGEPAALGRALAGDVLQAVHPVDPGEGVAPIVEALVAGIEAVLACGLVAVVQYVPSRVVGAGADRGHV